MTNSTLAKVMALDVGERRIGVAVSVPGGSLVKPLLTLEREADIAAVIQKLTMDEAITAIVVGLPRNADGEETKQSSLTRDFVNELKSVISIPIHFQDESLTSVKAEAELTARNKPFSKADIDSLAATYILEDFLLEQNRGMDD